MSTRYIHADDWVSDRCPNAPENPPPGFFYPPDSNRNAHICPQADREGYPLGDRSKYMTCENCGAMIWGFSVINEEPW